MALVIFTNGNVSDVRPKGKVFTFQEIQYWIGGYFEYISFSNVQMLIDEDGKIKNLKPNPTAMKILQKNGIEAKIVGTVMIAGHSEMSE